MTAEPYRLLDEDGVPVGDLPALSDDRLLGMYRDMVAARRLDERAVSLQRQGRMGTYAPLAGQEGAQIGSTYALEDEDWILYQYREHGAVVVRGLTWEYLAYWMGHEVGNEALADDNVFPLNITIGDHLPHAVGLSWAAKLKGESRVFLTHFGDGATSEGDFHEAMNFAGVFDTPTVFFCNNNQWAISVPREAQTASDTIAQKADAYGFDGVRVDGMDPLAVYEVTREAVRKARSPGDGEARPTLVEAEMYRYGAHTTADDPDAYRDETEVERWREKDPIRRLGRFLRETGRLDDERDDALRAAVDDELATLVAAAEDYDPDPEDMFAHAYESLPAAVEAQRAAFADLRERRGDGVFLRED